LRLFARVVRDGYFLDATIDPAQPERQPLPRPSPGRRFCRSAFGRSGS
jgi:hypothetical protein